MTLRPSMAAARPITWAASWTPWPPTPVSSSSRSTSALAFQAGDDEPDEVGDVRPRGPPAVTETGLHRSHGQAVGGLGVALGIGGAQLALLHGGLDGRPNRGLDELLAAPELLGEQLAQPRRVDHDTARGLGRSRVRRLGEDAFDPPAHLPEPGRLLCHLVLEVADELAQAVVQDGQQQLVLAAEMTVEGLVGQAGLGHDLAH